jgi:anti-anti-sigma factor
MASRRVRRYLEAEQIGNVTVVKFTQAELLEEATIQTIGQQLFSLVETSDHPQIILNFESVQKLSTMMLGKFVALHKKIQAAGGRLAICRIDPELYTIFEILKLPQLLPTYTDEQEALQTFQRRAW